MATVLKPAVNNPGHYREYEFAQNLALFEDPGLCLWFQLDSVPGIKDIDALLYHESLGVFVVEVKGVHLGDIQSISFDECVILDREERTNPNLKARNAAIKLREFLSPRVKGQLGGPTPIAAWPLIERRQWDQHWDNPEFTGDYSRRMIFKEDISAGVQVLTFRLQQIKSRPLTSVYRGAFQHSSELLKDIDKAIGAKAVPKPAPSDLDRLAAIERKIAKEAQDEAPPGAGMRLLYRGAPGTGKTFRLLAIGAAHAVARQSVLFVCYNKVLATDIRRLLSFSKSINEPDITFDVYDVYDMLRSHAVSYDIGDHTHDDWAALVVDDLRGRLSTRYDTILIDEAQDLPGWAFDFLDMQTKPSSTVCVGYGAGQELYDVESARESERDHAKIGKDWLVTFASTATKPTLNRNFRNTEPIFKLAQTFYESFGREHDVILQTLARFKAKKSSQQLALPICERKVGSLPQLRRIDESYARAHLEAKFYSVYEDERREAHIATYRDLIKNERAQLTAGQRPIDILILVPGSPYIEWARAALEELPYVDYTDAARRRDVAMAEAMRLCTFHSSRGIEAHKVIVLGIEELVPLAKRAESTPNNLGYIVLSRATIDLTIARPVPKESPVFTFLEDVLTQIQRSS